MPAGWRRPARSGASFRSSPASPIRPRPARGRTRRMFFLAGAAGAAGLWVNVAHQVPILFGIAMGAMIAAGRRRASRRTNTSEAAPVPPWRAWALGGAVASLVAYLAEFFPGHMGSSAAPGHPSPLRDRMAGRRRTAGPGGGLDTAKKIGKGPPEGRRGACRRHDRGGMEKAQKAGAERARLRGRACSPWPPWRPCRWPCGGRGTWGSWLWTSLRCA